MGLKVRFYDRVECLAEPGVYRRGVVRQISRHVMIGRTDYGVLIDDAKPRDRLQWFYSEQVRRLSLLELIAEAAQ